MKADVAPVRPGQVVRVNIDMTPVSRVVPAGARLRLTVAGADPRQRNLKDIRVTPAPVITVHRGGANASRLDLPVNN
jgi:predicted acyl esterase